jgi:hypothetical protein
MVTVTDILKPFLLTVLIMFIIVLFYSGETYYNILIAGVPILLISILIIILYILKNIFTSPEITGFNAFKTGITSVSPLLLLATSLSVLLYLMIVNKSRIIGDCNKDNNIDKFNSDNNSENICVSSEYSSFSFCTILLIIFQIIVLLIVISNTNFINGGQIETKLFVLLFLLAVINLLLMFPIYTILTVYTADG